MKSLVKSHLIVIGLLLLASTAQASTYTFSSFDYPGAVLTVANGINNNGDIVGGYELNHPIINPFPDSAYLLNSGGTFTTINLPVSDAFTTVANGINDSGTIVGFYADNDLANHAFIDTGGSFTIFQIPVSVPSLHPNGDTEANGINNGGAVVGHYLDFTIDRGFTKAGENITTINIPFTLGLATQLTGINNSGLIVGYYLDVDFTAFHGFLRDASGNFTSIDVPFPDAIETIALGINDAGSIIGKYMDSDFNAHGFLYTGGNFFPIDFPGAIDTIASGINNSETIVGTYSLPDGPEHGFIATPGTPVPEPATLLFLSSGLIGLAALKKKFKR
jgi:probable HAF family extracellular repeat protein